MNGAASILLLLSELFVELLVKALRLSSDFTWGGKLCWSGDRAEVSKNTQGVPIIMDCTTNTRFFEGESCVVWISCIATTVSMKQGLTKPYRNDSMVLIFDDRLSKRSLIWHCEECPFPCPKL